MMWKWGMRRGRGAKLYDAIDGHWVTMGMVYLREAGYRIWLAYEIPMYIMRSEHALELLIGLEITNTYLPKLKHTYINAIHSSLHLRRQPIRIVRSMATSSW